jgi:hypothetical protein
MTDSSELVTLEVLGFTATKTTLIYQVRQFLCKHLFDHLDSSIESFFRRAGNAEVERGILESVSCDEGLYTRWSRLTAAVAMLLSG